MGKRKAEEVEAGSSDRSSKVAKLTQEESQADSIDQAGDINTNISNDNSETGVTATNSERAPEHTTPNSPQDPSNDSRNITTAEATDTEPAQSKSKGKKKAAAVTSKPKATRKSTRSKTNAPTEPTTSKPVRKHINKTVQAKIQSTLDFIDTTPPRNPSRSTITITKSHLTAALMTLRQDYEISDPKWANIETDVGEAVIREFEGPIGTFKFKTEWVVLDLNVKTEIEKIIEEKIGEGWGLEHVKLLEVEIEIIGRQMEEVATLRFLEAVEEEAEKEKWLGVCPVPVFEGI
ncbi:hypothetical protein HII31_08823 [Pseudocercospora fuligena]|uniref:Uncharacterized protein n=1 Tax=Pseudocercospora fuligena TaxID=685502 RepID=A0A8H6REN2_9PEZI|nr:hypothetical protein HII31_08823 [Pseudocercospora fuligena]